MEIAYFEVVIGIFRADIGVFRPDIAHFTPGTAMSLLCWYHRLSTRYPWVCYAGIYEESRR